MTYDIVSLIFFLIVIVAASAGFTNAVESLGEKLRFSEGVTGSIFAAVGTALPETMIPIVAILAGDSGKVSEEVGVGAILGAPFMLSTLAMFLMGLAAWHSKGKRGKDSIRPEPTGFRRDIEFFLFAFTVSFLVAFTPHEMRGLRVFVSFLLVLTYFYYVLETVRASTALVKGGHATEKSKGLYLGLIFKEHMFFVLLQLLLSLALIVAGAKGFVGSVEVLAEIIHVPVIALSLIIVPVATELPEKINSIIWIRSGRDTMAVGNITGAMVFQGSLLPAIGIYLTPWTLNLTVVASSAITIIAGAWLYYFAFRRKTLRSRHLVLNGVLYSLFVAIVVFVTFAG